MLALAVLASCASLHGSFSVVPGSAGAGNIVYALRLSNTGQSACRLPGLPRLRLLGANGSALPTHVVWDRRRAIRAAVVTPGRSVSATARFSPDVPGTGEQAAKPCEPVAHSARLTVPGGTVVVKLRPPTRVCSHGLLQFSSFR